MNDRAHARHVFTAASLAVREAIEAGGLGRDALIGKILAYGRDLGVTRADAEAVVDRSLADLAAPPRPGGRVDGPG